MNVAKFLIQPLYWLAGKIFAVWARPTIQPEAPAELITDKNAAICYVLESGGLADRLALARACRLHDLPSPDDSLECCGERFSQRFVVLRPQTGVIVRRRRAEGSRRLRKMVETADQTRNELLLVPVAIYWGRSPDNPQGGWYGFKKGLRGRFANYVPPVLEALGLAEVEHNARNNRMRAL